MSRSSHDVVENNYSISNSGELTVSLLRGDSERISIALDLKGLLGQEGAVNVTALAEKVETALHEKGIHA